MYQNYVDDHVGVAETLQVSSGGLTNAWQADGRCVIQNTPGLHPAHVQFYINGSGHSNTNREVGFCVGTVGIANGEPNGQIGPMILTYEIGFRGKSIPPLEVMFIGARETISVPGAGDSFIPHSSGVMSDFYLCEQGGSQIYSRGKVLVDNRIKSTSSTVDCKTWFAGIRFHNPVASGSTNYDFWVSINCRLVTYEYFSFQPTK